MFNCPGQFFGEEDAPASARTQFCYDSSAGEALQCCRRRRIGYSNSGRCHWNGEYRGLEEDIDEMKRRARRPSFMKSVSIGLLQADDAPGACYSVTRLFRYPPQEEGEPPFPVSALTHGEKAVVVLATVPFKECTEIQQRLAEIVAGAQVQRYEKPAHSPVAVEERVDSFKLVVQEGALD